MPTLFTEDGYQVKMYYNDHPPAHVHVVKAENEARVTIDPIEVKTNVGFNSRELSKIMDIIRAHQDELIEKWKVFHPDLPEGN